MRVWWLLLAGCVDHYQGGLATRASACIDAEAVRGERSEAEGPLVVVRLGNRCDHRATVDLTALHVRGDGQPLVPFDPYGEIRELDMDAFAHGEEWLEFHPRAQVIEVDLGAIAGGTEARWVRL